MRELKFFPTIADIREKAGAGSGETADSDAAWMWVCDYLREHGVKGESVFTFMGELDRPTFGSMARLPKRSRYLSQLSCKQAIREYAESAEYAWLHAHDRSLDGFTAPTVTFEEQPAPVIPDRIQYALRQLGADVRSGLERIEEAKGDPKELGFTRKDFVAAYLRCPEAEAHDGLQIVTAQ